MHIVSSPPNRRRPGRQKERIGELAVLPVFYRLKGRHAVVAGGSEAAAWKAHLLAQAGATLTIHAQTLHPTFDSLLDPEQFVWHRGDWSADCFEGAQIAVGDMETPDEAAAFSAAAKAAGVPVNVIDQPEFCEFQFGSIVNRSPAVIGISTDGAAPVLGQAIRRRIEALLPAALQRWTEIAVRIRPVINRTLAEGAQRRVFWERFVDRAFAGEPAPSTEEALLAESVRIGSSQAATSGRVTFVGAGPGDAELVTLKAVRVLQAADIILFDADVSAEILELARREAMRMATDNGRGETDAPSDMIETMARLANAGKHVVRLKAGDAMPRGTAGDEIAALEARQIRVSVIPGIAVQPAAPPASRSSMMQRRASGRR